MKKHIYFIVRYSAYTSAQGSWQIGKGVTSDEYKVRLFSEDRLSLHEKLFFSVTLPSLVPISETVDMTALIFISDELPESYKKNLREAEKKYEWLEIAYAQSDKSLNKQIESHLRKKLEKISDDLCFATVRLDDDDALAPNFGTQLNHYIRPELVGMGVTFPIGVFGVFNGECYTSFYHYRKQNNAQGLAFINSTHPDAISNLPMTVMSVGNHNSIDERYPTINDSSELMFLRTEHEGSDLIATGRVRNKEKMKPLSEDEVACLKATFKEVKCLGV
ncbi:glycosyltransferase [Halomonas sp.]|uniref:glycosyltransferase n=1 Tax=Halomonas sp. TaxID=1486246 RepID=UPI003A8F144C